MTREQDFLLLCQSRMGGIAKFPGDYPGEQVFSQTRGT